ncbi:hypothetical protein MTO96_040416 [Rhipicephalus appendiculatus]
MGTGFDGGDRVVKTPPKREALRAAPVRGRLHVGLDGWSERCASRADLRAECLGRASSASRLLLLLLTLLRDCAAFSAEEAALYTQVVGSR